MEIRAANNSVIKRITFENSSNEAIAPTLKLVTREGNREIRQDVKPHEIRHLFIPRLQYQENKSRAGFLNNRRKDLGNKTNVADPTTESAVIYVPPEKLEGLDKEVELDPEEEFQVDESNHGLYLLNYSDTDNITQGSPDLNKTTSSNEIKENVTYQFETTTAIPEEKEKTTILPDKIEREEKPEVNTIANSTDNIQNTKIEKTENDKDKSDNQTLFMSQEIYNHFRPLETELPDEDMAPFIYFGQKLAGQAITDNLTNSPSLSASTKSVNFIAAPSDKRKFNSRYSATEKYKNTSAGEEEINEDMDVSVVKNVIEKNKIRNTVKGPAPARHVGLVNAYRKYSSTTQSTSKPQAVAPLNVTEPNTQNVTPSLLNENSNNNGLNNTAINQDSLANLNVSNTKEALANKTSTVSPPRNFTRTYFNLRRRPSRLTTLSSTENSLLEIVNATTEKTSTSVYTAVVTSVSITSSVIKNLNKTDELVKESENTTATESVGQSFNNNTVTKALIINETDITTTQAPSSTVRSYKHRIRIRTTTTEGPMKINPSIKPSESPITSDKYVGDIKQETTTSKISERLASLLKQNAYVNATNGITIRPKKNLRRRRPTTTSTTTTTTTTTTSTPVPLTTIASETESLTTPLIIPTTMPTTKAVETTESTFKPFIVVSRTSSESSSKPLVLTTNSSKETNNKTVSNNRTEVGENRNSSQNEEVVIEAEKTYTASYVLAGLGFLPVIAVVVFVLRNIMNKKTKDIDTEYEGYFDEGGDIKKESPITPVARPPLPTPTKPDQKWEFPRNKLRLQTLLGQGNFGQVNLVLLDL